MVIVENMRHFEFVSWFCLCEYSIFVVCR